MEESKGLVVAEKQVLFHTDNFSITAGLTLLLAAYYVILLFIQEHLLGIRDCSTRMIKKLKI